MQAQLLTAATATNGKPSAASDGVELKNVVPNSALAIIVQSTAGSGTMTVTLRLWVYSTVSSTWLPVGTNATADSKGLLNGGAAIGETNTDQISHTEMVGNLDAFQRAYLEVTAIGGTATAISAWLVGG